MDCAAAAALKKRYPPSGPQSLVFLSVLLASLCADGVRVAQIAQGLASCPESCELALTAAGPEVACALEECSVCDVCGGKPEVGSLDPAPTAYKPGAAGCSGMYREEQRGLKCGKHAVNAVLRNLGLVGTDEAELDAMAKLVGEPSEGEDYDLAALSFVLMSKLGEGAVQTVGELGVSDKAVSDMLKGVGKVDSEAALLGKKTLNVQVDDLQWLVCNTAHHWKTYFRMDRRHFCDLDSNPAALGVQAAEVEVPSIQSLKCRAIIIPIPGDGRPKPEVTKRRLDHAGGTTLDAKRAQHRLQSEAARVGFSIGLVMLPAMLLL